jgi:hypothetical protein
MRHQGELAVIMFCSLSKLEEKVLNWPKRSVFTIGLLSLAVCGFQADANASLPCFAESTVNTESELNTAIGCFNSQNPVGNHTITIGQDITTNSATSMQAITASAGELVIVGDGIQKVRTGPGSTSTGINPLLEISGEAKVTLQNLKLQAAEGAAVKVSGNATDVVFDEVSLFDSGIGLQIEAGAVTFSNSESKGHQRTGILLTDESIGIAPSLTMTNSEISLNGANGILYLNGDPEIPGFFSESRIHNNGLAAEFEDGSGIVVTGSVLDVHKSVISNNKIHGIEADSADLTLTDSLINNNSQNGVDLSGVFNSGSTIMNTGIYSNVTGLQVFSGIFDVHQSTINGNSVAGVGIGGSGTTRFYNTTVSENGDVDEGSGDGIVVSGEMELIVASSTIIKNAGDGLVATASTKVLSSIIAGNDVSNAGFQDCADIAPDTVQNLGANFDGDGTCGGFSNMPLMIIDAIADNGCLASNLDSSCVFTHSLLAGNPAIDSGDCGGNTSAAIPILSIDQRGVSRDSQCDAGAFEVTSLQQSPVASNLIAPNGITGDRTPLYQWQAVPNATWYLLWVRDTTSAPLLSKWFRAADVSCADGFGICSVESPNIVAVGPAEFYIRAWNSVSAQIN